MNRIIIENRSKYSDITVIEYVTQVMNMGRISNKGKQYCYFTTFRASGEEKADLGISTDLNKCSDRFVAVDL